LPRVSIYGLIAGRSSGGSPSPRFGGAWSLLSYRTCPGDITIANWKKSRHSPGRLGRGSTVMKGRKPKSIKMRWACTPTDPQGTSVSPLVAFFFASLRFVQKGADEASTRTKCGLIPPWYAFIFHPYWELAVQIAVGTIGHPPPSPRSHLMAKGPRPVSTASRLPTSSSLGGKTILGPGFRAFSPHLSATEEGGGGGLGRRVRPAGESLPNKRPACRVQ